MIHITDDIDLISKDEKAIVYFSADWCGPCKLLKPQFTKIAMQDNNLNYYLVNVDKVPSEYIQSKNIKSIPQIFVFSNGETIKRLEGRSYEQLKLEIENL